VSLRFHGELGLFLSPASATQPTPALKHAIEALGVPHTEIGTVLVLVDGRPRPSAGCFVHALAPARQCHRDLPAPRPRRARAALLAQPSPAPAARQD